ncbi:MAG: chromosome segregation SMC family protein, partial [Candidatus Anammoxibacter sp.]
MKLEKLELFGFKSFADKEEFIFEPGITVIVGPNGCGKSNVIDAIKWVLGEQSVKALRGNEMSDVIFGGGGSRPAMGFAEASLTMSNEDHLLPIEYDEVSITRRLYTSGESEYLINKNICRLKDIKELFLGTGVGVNSFSIIEQGKVEAILQANTYEKRHVFEEAAGISKFKARKKETLLKLEKTQQNLLRVNDIVREVERQLRSIKIQAGKASRYKEFCERLQELKIKLSLKNFQDLRNSKHDVINEIGLLSNNSKEVLSTIDSMEVDVLDLDNQLSGIDQKMSEANTDIASSDAKITNIKDKMNFCHERLEDIKQLESNYDEDVKTLKAKIEENEIKLINVKKDLENIAHGFKIDTEALASKETILDQIILETDMLAERVEEKKSEIMAVFHDQSKIQNEIGNQATINETLENRKHKIEKAQEDLFNQINSVGQNLQTLKDKHSGFICETENFGKEQSGLKDAVNTLDNEIRTIDSEIGQQERTRSSKQSRLEVLEDYETRAEGVDAGAKEILNKKDSFTGIFGLIADIIKVELPYAKAIETALGDLAQSVATGCYDDSIKAINFLKETDAGHATFLLIDKLNEANVAEHGLGNADSETENQNIEIQDQNSEIRNPTSEINVGIIGKASDIVKYDNEFKAVVEFLLGKTLVVQDFNKASSLMNSIYQNDDSADLIRAGYGDINRIVTLDGALIGKPGIIKGGVIREKPGLIVRKSEMQSIHVEISGIDRELERLQQERTLKTSDLNKSRESMDLTTEKLEKLNIVLLNSENEQKQETQTISKLNEEKEINASEMQEIKRDIDSIAERNLELRDKLCAANKLHEE